MHVQVIIYHRQLSLYNRIYLQRCPQKHLLKCHSSKMSTRVFAQISMKNNWLQTAKSKSETIWYNSYYPAEQSNPCFCPSIKCINLLIINSRHRASTEVPTDLGKKQETLHIVGQFHTTVCPFFGGTVEWVGDKKSVSWVKQQLAGGGGGVGGLALFNYILVMLTNVWICSVMFLKLLQLCPRSYFRHRRNTKGFTYDRVGVSAKGTDAMGATRHLELGETPCGTEVLGQKACWGQPVESRDGHVKRDVTAFRLQLCASHACLWSQVMHVCGVKSCMSVESSHAHKCYVTAAGYKLRMSVESSRT